MSIYESTQLIKLESIEILPSESENDTQTFKFKCTLCPLHFREKQELHSHVRGHFEPMTCEECNLTLIGDKQFNYHVKHVHNRKRTLNETIVDTSPKRNLTTNMMVKNENIEYLSSDSIEAQEFVVHDVIESINMNVSCDICGRLFSNNSAVARHRKTHSSEGKRFSCGICGNGFNKKTNLEFHMRIHTNERPFQCNQCPKAFSHVSGLNCHLRVHSGERPYKCPFCTKCYAHSTDLRRHRRTHGLEEKRFACNLCEKQFYENKFLRSHMKSHHDDTTRQSASRKKVVSTAIQITKLDECSNEEYVDYEYIQSD